MADLALLEAKKVRVVNHMGKIVTVVERDGGGNSPVLSYTVTDVTATDAPAVSRALDFPGEVRVGGMSLLTVPDDSLGDALAAPGQWQVLSDNAYLYLFRALDRGEGYGLYGNRYVMVPQPSETVDGAVEYVLRPKTEARYQQSRLRETPANAIDKPTYRDLDGVAFQEPVILFPGVAPENGRFAVTLLPTDQAPTLRWAIFCAGTEGAQDVPVLRYHAFLRDEIGWIDTSAPALSRQLALQYKAPGGDPVPITLDGMPALTMFRRQESTPGDGPDSLTGPRIMLAGRFAVPQAGDDPALKRLGCVDFLLDAEGAPVLPDGDPAEVVITDVKAAKTALEFDGAGNFVQVDEVAETPENLTFSFWFRAKGKPGTMIARSRSASDLQPGLTIDWDSDSNKLVASLDFQGKVLGADGADDSEEPGEVYTKTIAVEAPTTNQWHHLAVTVAFKSRDPEETVYDLAMMLDDQEATATATIKSTDRGIQLLANGPLFFGGMPKKPQTGDEPAESWVADFEGALDDIRCWTEQRSGKDVRDTMYRELKEPAAVPGLIGYWKFDDAFSDAPRIALDSSAGKHNGIVHGAQWTIDTAPVSGPDGPVVPPTLNGMSADMGLIDFIGDDVISDPTLADGADGFVHLYYASGEAPAENGALALTLSVLHYDTTVSRGRYAVGWETEDETEEGIVRLVARQAGPALNRGKGKTPVVSLAGTPGGGSLFVDATFTTSAAIDVVEKFSAAPRPVPLFAAVVNGTALDDPLDVAVKTGAVPFYDYSGTRPTLRLPLKDTGELVFVTARSDNAPSALPLQGAEVTGAGKTVTLSVRLAAANVKARVKPGGRKKAQAKTEIKRDFALDLSLEKVPNDGPLLYNVLDGIAPHSLKASGAKLCQIPAGKSPIYVVHGSEALSVAVSPKKQGRLADVTVTATTGGTETSATWEDVPTGASAFVAVMTLQANREYTEEQADMARNFVMVCANGTKPVSSGSKPVGKPEGLASFFNVIGVGLKGKLDVSGKIGLSPRQRQKPRPGTRKDCGSRLFALPDVAGPDSQKPIVVKPVAAVLDQAGNFGGWVPTPPTVSGDFAATAAVSKLDGPNASALAVEGDFTVEAWLRPQASAGQSRLITANTTRGTNYAIALREEKTYGVRLAANQNALTSPPFPGEPKVQTVGFWFKGLGTLTPDTNNAVISLCASGTSSNPSSNTGVRDPQLTLGRVLSNGQQRWEMEISYMTISPIYPVRVYAGLYDGEPIADDWYYVLLQRDTETGEVSLAWRRSGAESWQTGTFALDTLAMPAVDNIISFGTPAWGVPSTIGADQAVGEISLWTRSLSLGERNRLYAAPPTGNEAGLFSYFDIPLDSGVTAVESNALHGAPSQMSLPVAAPRVDNPDRPRHVITAGTGMRVAEAVTRLPKDSWSHLAVTCSDNAVASFDGEQLAQVPDSGGMSFDDALSIDGRFIVDALPAAGDRAAIIAKTDMAMDHSYSLYLNDAGQVFASVTIDDGNTYEFTDPALILAKGSGVYLAASFAIRETTDNARLELTFQTSDAGGEKQKLDAWPQNVFTTSLHCTFYMRTDAGVVVARTPPPVTLYSGNSSKTFAIARSEAEVCIGALAAEPSSEAPDQTPGYFTGKMGALRLWSVDIAPQMKVLAVSDGVPPAIEDGLEANWKMDEGQGADLADSAGGHDARLTSAYQWAEARLTSDFGVFVNGVPIRTALQTPDRLTGGFGKAERITFGGISEADDSIGQPFPGRMDDVRLWSVARSRDEVVDSMHIELSGGEAGLAGYWPVSVGSGTLLKDLSPNGNTLTLADTGMAEPFWAGLGGAFESPIGDEAPQIVNGLHGPRTAWQVHDALDAPSTVDYGAIYVDSQGVTRGVQYRGYAYLAPDAMRGGIASTVLIPGFKIGEADLTFIGQAQSDPVVVGYIEGAPPVPQENLTRPYFRSPARYQAYDGVSEIALSEADEVSYKYSSSKDTGFDLTSELGLGIGGDTGTGLVLAPFGIGIGIDGPKFEGNIGVKASFAYSTGFIDMAERATGTRRSRETSFGMGGNWAPVPADPETERQYVPDNTGVALVKSGTANVFALRLKRTGALSGMLMVPDPDVARDHNLINFPLDPNYTRQGTLDGMIGFETAPEYPEANIQRGSYFKPKEAANFEQQIKAYEASLEADYASFAAGNKGRRQAEGEESDPAASPAATIDSDIDTGFDWAQSQSRRNLVNTYVWTADGGLFSESSEALASRSETLGGSYSFQGMAGPAGNFKASIAASLGFYFEAELLLGGHVQTSVEKSREEAVSFSMTAKNDTESCLSRWVGDRSEPEDDGEATPGKVQGYRYKSFYFAPSRGAFDTLFNTVVDREWLDSNDSNAAQALRQARSAANHCWRVLHRVTYVDRVPPVFNRTPQDTAEAVARTLIDKTQNGFLMELVGDRLAGLPGSGVTPQRIGQAVQEVLAPGGPLASRAPWWDAFRKQAAADVTGPAADALALLVRTVNAYAIPYFEEALIGDQDAGGL